MIISAEHPTMDDTLSSSTQQLGKHRIEALSDGIFAVAMTLLVIDLRLPEHAHLATEADLRNALLGLVPNFYSWVVSFAVLAIFWMANHRLYHHVRHVDGTLLWYTMLVLGGASLLPFASAVNSQFVSQLAQLVYSGVMAMIAIGSFLVATRIYRNPQLCVHPMSAAVYRAARTRTLGLIAVAVLAVLLAGLVPGYANFSFLLIPALNPLNHALERRRALG